MEENKKILKCKGFWLECRGVWYKENKNFEFCNVEVLYVLGFVGWRLLYICWCIRSIIVEKFIDLFFLDRLLSNINHEAYYSYYATWKSTSDLIPCWWLRYFVTLLLYLCLTNAVSNMYKKYFSSQWFPVHYNHSTWIVILKSSFNAKIVFWMLFLVVYVVIYLDTWNGYV